MTSPDVIVVGSGAEAYRSYGFEQLAKQFSVGAVLAAEPTWQRRYLSASAVADVTEPDAIAAGVLRLATDAGVGVLTWDETLLEATAQAAQRLGLVHMSPEAASRCRDKYATRTLMAAAGMAPVRHRLVTSPDGAAAAARFFACPVVLKPRALAGSVGVVRADTPEAAHALFALTESSHYASLPTGNGVLVEELLEGPEVSVDSIISDGQIECVVVARKHLGFEPYFEEVGHTVGAWRHEPWAGPLCDLVAETHEVLGVRHGSTHAEVRLTVNGPRLVELNGRLGGDLIPHLGRLATGVDLVVAAAEVALGRRPRLVASRSRTAAVRFVYPQADCIVERINLDRAAGVPGIVRATALSCPGTTLRLPPRGAIPRLAALVAVGTDGVTCDRILDRAEALVELQARPAPDSDHDAFGRELAVAQRSPSPPWLGL